MLTAVYGKQVNVEIKIDEDTEDLKRKAEMEEVSTKRSRIQ